MNYDPFKLAWLMGALVWTGAQVPATAEPPRRPTPDAGLLAAVDAQLTVLDEGVTHGDFEALYPGVYPGFQWVREIREVGRNGLFRLDYEVASTRPGRREAPDQLSILLYRPLSRPGAANGGWFAASTHGGQTPARLPAGPVEADAALTLASRATRRIEEALISTRFFVANARQYSFFGDTQSLSFVARLADSCPGMQADAGLRRVRVFLEPRRHGRSDLVLEHAPLLLDTRPGQVEPVRIILASEVSVFDIQFWDGNRQEWLEEWPWTNSVPPLIQVTVGAGPPYGKPTLPHDLSSRMVSPLMTAVQLDLQLSPGPTPVLPGFPPTNRPPGIVFPPFIQPPPAPAPAADAGGQLAGVKRASDTTGSLSSAVTASAPGDIELEWLGRSGVELARYILAQDSVGPSGSFDSLRHKWAGGPGNTNGGNGGGAAVPLESYPLGRGIFSVRIVDQERKFNINTADELRLMQALTLIGVDAARMPGIVNSILDWRDPDDASRLDGAENVYYLGLNPPRFARNGPIDDLSELLRVKGVTPDFYFGAAWSGGNLVYALGLADLFTPLSSGRLNVNTTSAAALQLLFPEFDQTIAHAIIRERAGPDGVDGSLDDAPFRTAGELAFRVRELAMLNVNPQFAAQLNQLATVRSLVFEATVNVESAGRSSEYSGWLRRNNPREIPVLHFHRK